ELGCPLWACTTTGHYASSAGAKLWRTLIGDFGDGCLRVLNGKRAEFYRQPKKPAAGHVRGFGTCARKPRPILARGDRNSGAAVREVDHRNQNACGAAGTRVQHTGVLDRQAVSKIG